MTQQPLHLAALSSNLQLVQVLLERGARVEDKNGQRKTAFQLARSNPLLSLAAALMQDVLHLYDINKKGFFKDEATRAKVKADRDTMRQLEVSLIRQKVIEALLKL